MRFEIWIHRDRGYLVDRYPKYWGESLKNQAQFRVVEYHEHTSGFSFPSRFELMGPSGQGEWDTRSSARLTSIHNHDPMEVSLFVPQKPPRGTLCHDRTRNVEYPIDENWQRIGSEKAAGDVTVLPMGSKDQGVVHYSQTAAEPRRVNWVLWGSVVLVLLGVVLGALRRLRRGRPHGG